MSPAWIVFALLLTFANAADIELSKCDPPDEPIGGGYYPKSEDHAYVPGDVVHYYCDLESHIGGNYYRRCEDTGDWTGETPVCDSPTSYSSVSQSSTVNGETDNEDMAIDGSRTTCTSTMGGRKEEWSGTFTTPGELIRVMIFLPKGPVSYEVVLVKPDGKEVICGSKTETIDRYDWYFHNCPGPANQGASGVKIRSLSNAPLKICELAAHVLTSPKCPDPRVRIEHGHLLINRKRAVLKCDKRYSKSRDDKLVCLRDGVWSRKILYCYGCWHEPMHENTANNPGNEDDEP